ncbi:MAG: hypothetical protein LUH14_06825 [Clostridiaceae bacterium]|nr:hypothetical protein [Clostridiaceae bacterium]
MDRLNMQESLMELPGGPNFPADTDIKKLENISDLTGEQRRKLETECKLAQTEDEMSQLVDRIAGNSFQG